MFKIKRIILNGIDEYKFNDDYTLIYGPNNVGKSILIYLIDYMLGSGGELNNDIIWNHDGMDNVDFVEIEIFYGEKLFLKRNRSESFYKRNINDNYILIDDNEYKNMIQSSLTNDPKIFDEYFLYVNEKLSYRGFSYINVIDQYALGNISNIFPETIDYRYTKRLRSQMSFIFDKELLKEYNDLQNDKKEIAKKLKDISELIQKKKLYLASINEKMNYLNICNSDDYDEKKANFNNYLKKNKESTKSPINKDLNYLISVSNNLASQIEIEKNFGKQSKLIDTRNKKIIFLMNVMKNALGDNEKYRDYLSIINSILEKSQRNSDILSLKDYSASIEMIVRKKEEIDSDIAKIKNCIQEKNVDDIQTAINLIQYSFEKIDNIRGISGYDKLEKRYNELDKKIQSYSEKFGNTISKDLNEFITLKYKNFNESLSYVNADKKINGFELQFIPRKMSIIGKEVELNRGKETKIDYLPGSKARQSCWQILSYIGLIKYIKDTRNTLPLMPVLLIDGINEPFTNTDFEIVFKEIAKICKEINIQLIVTSTHKYIEENHFVDLSNGLNSKHKR